MDFNNKLQQLRKQKNLTQEELAEALFVSRTAISKWESGRGYPNIDSLKALSKFFAVSIDDLLSCDELISLAETESKEKVRNLRDLMFGILDCVTIIFFFLPIFGLHQEDMVVSVSLFALSLSNLPSYILIPYNLIIALTIAWGIIQLTLQNFHHKLWIKKQTLCINYFKCFRNTVIYCKPTTVCGYAFVFSASD